MTEFYCDLERIVACEKFRRHDLGGGLAVVDLGDDVARAHSAVGRVHHAALEHVAHAPSGALVVWIETNAEVAGERAPVLPKHLWHPFLAGCGVVKEAEMGGVELAEHHVHKALEH